MVDIELKHKHGLHFEKEKKIFLTAKRANPQQQV